MRSNIKVAFYLLKSNGRRKPTMAHKLLFLSLLVICVTVLIFTWLTSSFSQVKFCWYCIMPMYFSGSMSLFSSLNPARFLLQPGC